MRSWNLGVFDITGFNCTTAIIELSVVSTLGEARDLQYCTFSLAGRATSARVDQCHGIAMNGDSIANVSLNTFKDINFQYHHGHGLLIGSADSNTFENVRCASSGGTGKGVVLLGSDLSSTATARANRFQLLSPVVGGVLCKGTTSYVHPSEAP